ncbi:capsule biosynthesis protein [Paracoccaceae bacterium GXU_MW_L88]
MSQDDPFANLTGKERRRARRKAARRGLIARDDYDAARQLYALGDDVRESAQPAKPDMDARPTGGLPQELLDEAIHNAKQLGIEVEDGYDAVRKLREAGFDILEDYQMEAAKSSQGADGGDAEVFLPARQVSKGAVGAYRPAFDDEARAAEIARIQRDLARRRRRKMAIVGARLLLFVLLPTALVGYYFFNIATPFYSSHSQLVIQKADMMSAQAPGMFSGSGFATQQDSMVVQGYLQGQEAMLRLDETEGWVAAFQGDEISELQRLPENVTSSEAYDRYKKLVRVGYDPSEGIIKMDVIAPTGEKAFDFASRLIQFAEERVDSLSQDARTDQVAEAEESLANAERSLDEAQERLLALQSTSGVLSADAEAGSQMSIITTLEGQITEKRVALQTLLANASPNQARVNALRGEVRTLERRVEELRGTLTSGSDADASLAAIQGQIRIAESEMLTRETMLAAALERVEAARLEANRQTRYLAMVEHPVLPDEPSYPRRYENTALAFVIFAMLYLVVSITISMLREQVSV